MVSTLLLLLLVSSATAASLPPLVFQSPVQCRQTTRTVAPKIAQNIDGQLKFIHQPEGEAGQLLEVRVCEAAGSSCSACADRAAGRARVCQQTYRRARLYVLGDNLRDLVLDTFSVPDGCRCVAES